MKWISRQGIGLCVSAVLLCTLVSCSEDEASPGACDHKLPDDSCAGVSTPEICSGTYCTEAAGLTCAQTLHVNAGASAGGDGSAANPFAELQQAADRAKAGDCIAIAAGAYSAATIVGGVSMLGAGAKAVTISSAVADVPALAIKQGKGGLIRGVTFSGEGRGLDLRDVDGLRIEQVRIDAVRVVGIYASNATNLVIENVHVKNPRASEGSGAQDAGMDAGLDGGPPDAGPDAGAPDAGAADAQPDSGVTTKLGDGFGILLLDGSSAHVTGTFVEGSAVTGIYVVASSIHLESSAVVHSGYFGVAIADCLEEPGKPGGCATVPGSEVHKSSLAHNAVVGLLVKGVDIVARDNDIGHTRLNYGAARNVQLHGNATVTLERNKIHHSAYEGVVVDGCTGTLVDNTIEENQERGLWLQHVAQPGLTLTDNTISNNEWVGLGATDSVGVTVKGGQISGTKKRYILVQEKPVELGDGVQLLGKSAATIDGVQIQANGRIGLLIDDAKATVSGTTITGGEDQLVVQNASLNDQTLTNNTGEGGAAVKPTAPTAPYYVNADPVGLVSCDPIPLP